MMAMSEMARSMYEVQRCVGRLPGVALSKDAASFNTVLIKLVKLGTTENFSSGSPLTRAAAPLSRVTSGSI